MQMKFRPINSLSNLMNARPLTHSVFADPTQINAINKLIKNLNQIQNKVNDYFICGMVFSLTLIN
jgi:hypothetical protein